MRRAAWLGLALLAGCTDVVQHGAVASLVVQRQGCQGEDRAAGADTFRVRVLKDGALFAEETGGLSQGWPAEIGVPEAGAAQVRVEAFLGAPDAGRLVAWGQSRLVADGAPRAGETFTVPLAPANRFAEVCTRLLRPRGGHTATVLGDDRVLVAGGFGPDDATSLASIEALSPFDASSSEVGQLAIPTAGTTTLLPRGSHAALRVTPAQVLLWGGEQTSNGTAVSLATALVFDVDVRACGALVTPQYPAQPRAFHALAPVGNEVYVYGGLAQRGGAGTPVTSIERVDLTTFRQTEVGSFDGAREDAALAATADGQALFAGGVADGGVSAEVDVLHLESPLGAPWRGVLSTPRRRASALTVGEAFLVAGGVDGQGAGVSSTEWVHLDAPVRIEAGPAIAPRAQPCLATLGDGRVFVFGGDANGQPSGAAEVLSPDGTVEAVAFPGPARRGHTCTTLSDGSVLVLGGLTTGGAALDDAWRFVPQPPPLSP